MAHRLAYKKRTAIGVEMGTQLEEEGRFPQADYACDKGVLPLVRARLIESKGNHWVSERESARHMLWEDRWQRIEEVAAMLRRTHPERFRQVSGRCRKGETKEFWAFTKSVRLKRYGRKRIVMVHERADLRDAPRFLVTDALGS